jgi:hypothetical protein
MPQRAMEPVTLAYAMMTSSSSNSLQKDASRLDKGVGID